MREKVTVTYSGIEIEYQEIANKWRLELRGRERKFDSLQDAKKAIDAPEPVKKQKFERIPVFILANTWDSVPFHKGHVSSVAEYNYSGSNAVWIIRDSNQERSKINSECVYQQNAKNVNLIAEYAKLRDEIKTATNRQSQITKELDKVTPLLPAND